MRTTKAVLILPVLLVWGAAAQLDPSDLSHISQDRMIRLGISLEVTVLDDPNDDRPSTLKRTIDTTVLVKDKSTIVIGGLIDHAFSNVEYRVPCLGDIPIMGWLFKSMGRRDEKTNLYIFLSPRVVENHLEAEEIYHIKKNQIDGIKAGEIKLYDPEVREKGNGGD